MSEDRIGQLLTRVERPISPDEAFGEKLFVSLAAGLDTATVLSRVEQPTAPDEAFSERLFPVLAGQLANPRELRKRAFVVAIFGRIADSARQGLSAFRLQAAAAALAALGIFALFLNSAPVSDSHSPGAGPRIRQDATALAPGAAPSTPANGCVCPIAGGRGAQPRAEASAPVAKGELPPSSRELQIAFSRISESRDARFQIFTMNLDGTNLRRVTPDDNHDYRQPSWSPDHKRLVFTRTEPRAVWGVADRGGRGTARFGEIFVANADGSNMHRIATGGAPEWSPDGSLIVYHAGDPNPPNGIDPGPAIWTMEPDGTNAKMVTESGTNGTDPTWSPDGNYIAFGSLMRQSQFPNVPKGAINEFRMRADGTDIRQLTGDPVLACFGDWSPDGTNIAYTSQLNAFTRLMLMKADGSGHHQITHDDVSNVAPSWSPDGSLIAFEHAPRGDLFYLARPADPNGDLTSIWVMKPDGSLRVRVSPPGDRWSYYDPAFAP